MKIASVLSQLQTLPSDENLKLASQVGVTDVVIRYPGPDYSKLHSIKTRIESFGLNATVVEGYLPLEEIKMASVKRNDEIEQFKTAIRYIGQAGIPLVCYNFMAGGDWARTSVNEPARGGAFVTAFNINSLPPPSSSKENIISSDQLWENLKDFLEQVLPIAEEAGVTLVMHPDDPPLPTFQGYPRIMNSIESFERLVNLVPSPANGICFCQGSFAEMEVDIPSTIRRLGKHIKYVHFRDIRGTTSNFVETFHDNGQTNMVEAMKAYHDIGFQGPIRPDHVPQLTGEEQGEPGYTMLGRLFAIGYIHGLIQAVQQKTK